MPFGFFPRLLGVQSLSGPTRRLPLDAPPFMRAWRRRARHSSGVCSPLRLSSFAPRPSPLARGRRSIFGAPRSALSAHPDLAASARPLARSSARPARRAYPIEREADRSSPLFPRARSTFRAGRARPEQLPARGVTAVSRRDKDLWPSAAAQRRPIVPLTCTGGGGTGAIWPTAAAGRAERATRRRHRPSDTYRTRRAECRALSAATHLALPAARAPEWDAGDSSTRGELLDLPRPLWFVNNLGGGWVSAAIPVDSSLAFVAQASLSSVVAASRARVAAPSPASHPRRNTSRVFSDDP